MHEIGILRQGGRHPPLSVKLDFDAGELRLIGSNAFVDSVRWRLLFREPGQGSIHRFGRLGKPGWELSVPGGGNQALLSHVRTRPLARLMRPLHRLHLFKAVAGMLFLTATVFEQLPAPWVARALSASARSRLVDGYVDNQAPVRCDHPGGESAVRAILTRLDPELGPKLDIIGIREGGIFALALPSNKILLFHDTTSQIDPDALAGLLAHELAHLRHDDPTAAMVRYNGNLGIFAAWLNGPERRQIGARFSGEEERVADEAAIGMMKRAHVRLAPVAALIEQMRISQLQGTYLGDQERSVHFGMTDRSRRFTAAAANDPPGLRPVLEGNAADNLFNFCWVGKVLPVEVSTGVGRKP